MIQIAPMTEEALDYVLARLRKADADELRAAGLNHPRETFLRAARDASYTGVVLVNGEAAAIFGVNSIPDEDDVGLCWAVGTDQIHAEPFAAARASVRVVRQMRRQFSVLRNWVHCEHADACRWLLWLGFDIDPQPVGPNGRFFAFSMGE